MGNAFKVCLIVVAAILISAFLSPVIYHYCHDWPNFKFNNIVNRIVQICLVVAMVLFVRTKKIPWKEYGFDFSAPWKRLFLFGFVGGALSVFLISAVETAYGVGHVRTPVLLQDVIERFFKGAASGIAVGIVEEFICRGFIFVNLEKRIRTWWAMLVTNIFYSVVHFLDNGQVLVPDNPTVADSFRVLFGYVEPIVRHAKDIMPECIGLFLFGLMLNVAFVRTRSLYLSIGLHAGCVFWVKFQHSFFRKGPEVYHAWFGSGPLYDGVFEWLVLVSLGILVFIVSPMIVKQRCCREL